MIKISQLLIEVEKLKHKDLLNSLEIIKRRVSGLILVPEEDIGEIVILKKSLDARKKPNLFYSFAVAFSAKNEAKILKKRIKNVEEYKEKRYLIKSETGNPGGLRPVVVGFGPCGIGAAFVLAKRGLRPFIIERGSRVETRAKSVEDFWLGRSLDINSNVQFGEGGAGAFSDGKLTCGNKDKDGLQRAILKTLVKYGAPESIVYDSHPHVGTDILRNVVKNLRLAIEEMGGEFLFDTKLTGIVTEEEGTERRVTGVKLSTRTVPDDNFYDSFLATDRVILAIGHSARDTFRMLCGMGVELVPKPFAVGYRVIHSQEFIDRTQYGAGYEKKGLAPSAYKLTYTTKGGTPVYSFCMCPGGYVVNSSSEAGGLCVNGMSYSGRGGAYANSAVVMGINVPNGIEFQEELEKKAFDIAEGKIPYCLGLAGNGDPDFSHFVPEKAFKGISREIPNLVKDNLILPEHLNREYTEAMEAFSRFIPGFKENTVAVVGVESRTSSPVRIPRDKLYESVKIKGLFPGGEGAGFAGGIMSAAMDGCRIANSL